MTTKLKDLVCSKELAKELKRLKIEQNSIYMFWEYTKGNYILISERDYKHFFGITSEAEFKKKKEKNCYSAFLCSELNHLIPETLKINDGDFKVDCELVCQQHGETNYSIYYCDFNLGDEYFKQVATTEANARARMVIYLHDLKLPKEK